jgi:2-(1,2-epoxy-1,2-dihydrophenyl)acetyl-CoA isomerase
MKTIDDLTAESDLFAAECTENTVVLRFRENLLARATEPNLVDNLLRYFDRVSQTDQVKVVILTGSPLKSGREEYLAFYRQVLTKDNDPNAVHRLYNLVDQFILKIMMLNKYVIHADSGCVMSLFFNVSLACDYRIVADNTVFQNSYLDLGMVPKGGGAFFLSKLLGTRKAFDLLLSEKDLTAQDALTLGIVDRVVPLDELDTAARSVADRIVRLPASSVAGLKRLVNYTLKELTDYLALENQELLKIVRYTDLFDRICKR